MGTVDPQIRWNEDTSQQYLDYGRYFIPDREGDLIIDDFPVPVRHYAVLIAPRGLKARVSCAQEIK